MRGIYRILMGNNFYIGRSVNIEKRVNDHLKLLKKRKHYNPHLQSAYEKYGLQYEVIEEIEMYEDMIKREQELINEHMCDPKCMNISSSALGGGISGFTFIMTDETKKKLRDAAIKQHLEMSDQQKKEWIDKIQTSRAGYTHSEETRIKIGNGTRGKSWSQQSRDVLREKVLQWHREVGMTEETKKKISEAHKGVPKPPRTEEHNAKIAETLRGKELSEEHRQRISEGTKGKNKGASNGASKTVTVIFTDGTELIFGTIGELAEHFEITRAQVPSLLRENSKLREKLGVVNVTKR